MNKRWIFILIGAVVILGVLFAGVAAGGVLVYVLTRTNPVQAAVGLLQQREVSNADGVLVAWVDEGSPAAEAGIVRGDILYELNGESLVSSYDLARKLSALAPGDSLELRFRHGDDEQRVTVALAERNGLAYLGIGSCGPGMGRAWSEGMPPEGMPYVMPYGELEEMPFHNFSGGAQVVEVIGGSPAEAAGLQVGDVILSVDGKELSVDHSLAEVIQAKQPGDRISLEVKRSSEAENLAIEVTLAENPDAAGQAYLGVSYRTAMMGSGSIMPFDEDEMPFWGIPFGHELLSEGALVTSIVPGSPAEQAGLSAGDVITAVDGELVDSAEALVEKIKTYQPGEPVELAVARIGQDGSRTVTVVLAENPDAAGTAFLGVGLGGAFRFELQAPDPGDSESRTPLPEIEVPAGSDA